MPKSRLRSQRARCKLCNARFATTAELHDHARVTPNHCPTDRCDCDTCNPTKLHLDKKDSRRTYSIRHGPPKLCVCEVCNLELFTCATGKQKHARTPQHRNAAIEKGLYCADLEKSFFSTSEFEHHQRQHHQTGTQYHCVDCDTDFPSQCALKRHPKNDQAHGKRLLEIPCDECGSTFPNNAQLAAHRLARRHKKMSRVRCLAYPTCPRRFTTKGGMMAHLESGACRSKITRKRIDDLIRQHDTNNVILKVGAGGGTPPYFSITPSPAPSGSITSELSESDSDDEGTIIFSATTSATLPHEDPMIFSPVSSATMSRRDETSFSPVSSATLSQHEETIIFSPSSSATISRQESFMDTALIPTPSYALSAESTPGPPGFDLSSGRVCYICGKGFKAIKGLEQHLNSITHEPRIYHCPTFLFAGATTKPQKDFISISGLIMHLESGACEGGSEGLDRALEFVEEKLNEEGVGHLLRG